MYDFELKIYFDDSVVILTGKDIKTLGIDDKHVHVFKNKIHKLF